jgi:hypothetical protein
MADGDRGRGHFTSMAEIRAAILDHDRRITLIERALYSALTYEAVKRAPRKRNRRPRRTTKGE